MSIRADLATRLRTAWSTHPVLKVVRVVSTEKNLGDVKQPTVLIRQKSIGTAKEAPLSYWAVGMLLTVISKHTDPERGAVELDDIVPAILAYLDKSFQHEDAEAVAYGSERLAYDIPTTVLAPKG
ncbi:hypothetical protein [uncultured Microbacterium sp.]|uniref:hypothetical protein n=1 Tax=uncultured Microbacterium sp. TaxID=191216 RepID=UPI0025CE2754|nr:hypothetical protein [uncultured Microbacterium sp.]